MIKNFVLFFSTSVIFFSLEIFSTQLTVHESHQQGLRLGQAKEYLRTRSKVDSWEQTNIPFLVPLVSLQNSYAEFSNEFSRSEIDQFMRGRHYRQVATKDDMLFLGPLLIEDNSPLIKQLSVSQAFVLRKINEETFRNLSEHGFGSATAKAARLFLCLVDKSESDLAKALDDEAVKELLIANEIVINELLNVIPRHRDNYLKLMAINNLIASKNMNVASSEEPFNYPFDRVIIKTDKCSLSADTSIVYFKSDRIRDIMDEFHDEIIELPSRADDFIPVLAQFCETDNLKITDEKILHLLDAARYFGMAELAKNCDHYIVKNNLLKFLVFAWLGTDNNHYDAESLSMQWHFCERYRLHETKKILGENLLKTINNLQPHDDKSIREIMAINAHDRNEILTNADIGLFHHKLKDVAFFSWAWGACQYIKPLRKSIQAFCAQAHNKEYLDTIEPILPRDIAVELAAFRTYKCRKTYLPQ